MPLVPRRNPETSLCDVRKSVRNSLGVAKTIEVVRVVRGVSAAKAAVEKFTQTLTDLEKDAGIFFDWEYASRQSTRAASNS
jgi:hypothetical protein